MSFQSPPTTSGIVVISGSQNFDALLSDFPMPGGLYRISMPTESRYRKTGIITTVLHAPDNVDITVGASSVTTSGIVVFEFYPGAGAPYIIPFVINARLFPISAAAFPTTVSGFESTVSGERIYPVLPQYSTIIP